MTDLSPNATPDFSFSCLTDITAEDIKEMNVRVVAIDLDNTSVYDCTMTPIRGVRKWIREIKNAGFKVVIISNSFALRGKVMGRIFGCPSYGPAAKPDTKIILQAAEESGVEIGEMALIGDRLFTDIVGANNSGAVSVHVKPYKRELSYHFYWKDARQAEIDYLKKLNINRDLKTIYYR